MAMNAIRLGIPRNQVGADEKSQIHSWEANNLLNPCLGQGEIIFFVRRWEWW